MVRKKAQYLKRKIDREKEIEYLKWKEIILLKT